MKIQEFECKDGGKYTIYYNENGEIECKEYYEEKDGIEKTVFVENMKDEPNFGEFYVYNKNKRSSYSVSLDGTVSIYTRTDSVGFNIYFYANGNVDTYLFFFDENGNMYHEITSINSELYERYIYFDEEGREIFWHDSNGEWVCYSNSDDLKNCFSIDDEGVFFVDSQKHIKL